MTRSRWFALSVLLLLSGIATQPGCSSSEDEAPVSVSPTRKVKSVEGITVINATDDVVVDKGSLELPANAHPEIDGRKPGEFLIGDRGTSKDTKNPVGFLRRITSIERKGANYVVGTEYAAITDIIESGEFKTTLAAPKASGPTIKSLLPTPGLKPQGTGQLVFEGPTLGLPDLTLKESTWVDKSTTINVTLGGKSIPLKFYATVKGSATGGIGFTPSVDIGFDIESFKLREFHTLLTGKLEGSLTLSATGEVGVSTGSVKVDPFIPEDSTLFDEITHASKDEMKWYMDKLKGASEGAFLEWTLLEQTIPQPPIVIPTVPVPIPIPTAINISVKASCSPKIFLQSTAKFGGKLSGALSIGARYSNFSDEDKWDPVFDPSWSATAVGPDVTGKLGAELSCELKVSVGMIFVGFAGPYIYFGTGPKVGAGMMQECDGSSDFPILKGYTTGAWTYGAGVGAKLGVFVPGYSLELAKKEFTLASKEVELWNESTPSVTLPYTGWCGNTCGADSSCKVGVFEVGDCGSATSIKVCSENTVTSCLENKARDCKDSSVSCYQDPRKCACGTECSSEGAVGSCTGATAVLVCRTGPDGCRTWEQQPCKGSGICFTDPNACAGVSAGSCKAENQPCTVAGDCCAGLECKKDPGDNTLACLKPAGCVPTTCGAKGFTCGTTDDGCGTQLSCGTCASGKVCSSNQCVPAGSCATDGEACSVSADCCGGLECNAGTCKAPVGCTPKTCLQQGYECGSGDDGCGNSISCGSCGGGNTCVSNTCQTCDTCGTLGWSCGTGDNGCGQTIDCGTCGAGETCSSHSCVTSAVDPCSTAPQNGQYCGVSPLTGGNAKTLYTCTGGVTTNSQVCASSCQVCPPGTPDTCGACPGTCAAEWDSCTIDANCCTGLVCKKDPADNTLACQKACATMTCGGKCCPSGTVNCGSGGQCCDGITCTAGCPC